jgi:acyl-CoA reductase-like NAD-dependent aldehyde dehydrogenase
MNRMTDRFEERADDLAELLGLENGKTRDQGMVSAIQPGYRTIFCGRLILRRWFHGMRLARAVPAGPLGT